MDVVTLMGYQLASQGSADDTKQGDMVEEGRRDKEKAERRTRDLPCHPR